MDTAQAAAQVAAEAQQWWDGEAVRRTAGRVAMYARLRGACLRGPDAVRALQRAQPLALAALP